MATWAYECRACGSDDVWLVSRQQVDEELGPARIVRVRTGAGWKCAVVDRSHALAVEAMLLREVIASDGDDCPECAALLSESARETSVEPAPVESASEKAVPTASASVEPEHVEAAGPAVHAAAISIQDRKMLVVLVGLSLIQSPGEADMVISDLRARFGGVDVILMGQEDDGTPRYHGDAELVSLLAHIPVDQMPWKVYGQS
jgi:hypothetical protein